MKKLLILALAVSALFLSCALSEDDSGINGKWVLSTIDGAPISAYAGLFSITMTVSNEAAYTATGTLMGEPFSGSGTVSKKSDTVYAFIDGDGDSTDYTLDGDTLSCDQVDEDDPTDITELVFKRD